MYHEAIERLTERYTREAQQSCKTCNPTMRQLPRDEVVKRVRQGIHGRTQDGGGLCQGNPPVSITPQLASTTSVAGRALAAQGLPTRPQGIQHEIQSFGPPEQRLLVLTHGLLPDFPGPLRLSRPDPRR